MYVQWEGGQSRYDAVSALEWQGRIYVCMHEQWEGQAGLYACMHIYAYKYSDGKDREDYMYVFVYVWTAAISQFFKDFFVLCTVLMGTKSPKPWSAVEIIKTPINWLEKSYK